MEADLDNNKGTLVSLDSRGRLSLGKEFANLENWYLHHDLSSENCYVIRQEFPEKKGVIKAYTKPLTFDDQGRCYIIPQLRHNFEKARLKKLADCVVIYYN